MVYKQGAKISETIFGFMGLGGKDVVMVSDKAKAPDMIKFIELIRKENPCGNIYVFLDNAQIHKADTQGKISGSEGGAGEYQVYISSTIFS